MNKIACCTIGLQKKAKEMNSYTTVALSKNKS
jgi:hypothetical protein